MRILFGIVLLFSAMLFNNQVAFAWGLRGHHTVCEAAIFNIKEEGLQTFVKTRIVMAGHLCNIPDIAWKGKSAEVTALGSPAHYVDPEVLGLPIKDIPLDYKKIEAEFTGKDNKHKGGKIINLHSDFGSVWWRADQFMRLALEQFTTVAGTPAPINKMQEQDMKLPYNKGIADGMVRMFLTGHFVGDAGQPLHSSADYDGYGSGHGGLHSFYEETMVDRQDDKFSYDVIQEGKRLRKLAETAAKQKKPSEKVLKEVGFLLQPTILERMRAFSVLSSADLAAVVKLDKVKKPSEIKNEKGMELKTPAEREITPALVSSFRPLLIKHMGRSAALLSMLWDEMYVKSGRPNLAPYKSYFYPFEPEFIAPDYLTPKTAAN